MRIVFTIQGEGRGHTMQAVVMKEILERHGHELVRVFKGIQLLSNPPGSMDLWFNNPVYFLSPYFIPKRNRQGINLWLTFAISIVLLPAYIFETIRLGYMLNRHKPDIIINFYDIIGGMASFFTSRNTAKYVISHHFFFEHPDFNWPEERKFERMLLQLHSFLTSWSAGKKLALSFTKAESIPDKRLFIVPPLLRKKILEAQTGNNKFILIYTLYHGYYSEIRDWCRVHPSTEVKMFSNFKKIPVREVDTFEVFQINEEKFTELLPNCSLVSGTAGFETLAEAAFLGKPLVVVPSGNHFEQLCNAMDLERAGLGSKKENDYYLQQDGF